MALKRSRLTIGLVRRGHSETGGAEAYLKRLAGGLARAGQETRLFTDASWPASEWPWGPIVRLRGDTPRRFADELEKAHPREQCDLVLSLERIWRCDVYRAGDGIHRAWLQRRDAATAPLQRFIRRFGRSHRETLELEEALFRGGGAGHVIANSELVRREAHEIYGYPAEKIDIVRNGVPLAEFGNRQALRDLRRKNLGLAAEDIAVLLVGSGWERKGLRFARAAVQSLGKEFQLLVAGRGRKLPDGRAVRMLGAVRDLPALYAAADIFLLPTLYDPFSNACLEALAAGLPVITTRANGFSEIIEDGVHGSILREPTEIEPIIAALRFWADPERRRAAQPDIFERASHFDITTNVERTLAVLHQVASAVAVSGKMRNT